MIARSLRPVVYVPPPLRLPWETHKVVFTEFRRASYDLVFDCATRELRATTQIELYQYEQGFPVVDVAESTDGADVESEILSVAVDGQTAGHFEVSTPLPGLAGGAAWRPRVRALTPGQELGLHMVRFEQRLRGPLAGWLKYPALTWLDEGVRCQLRMSDRIPDYRDTYDGRHFLERYLPANLEYDRYPSAWTVRVVGAKASHDLFVNVADVVRDGDTWSFTTPPWFNCSSLFFLLAPETGSPRLVRHVSRCRSGPLPVTVVDASGIAPSATWLDLIADHVNLLEQDLGAFPFPALIVCTGSEQNMEYAGAVCAGRDTLLHELFHCYFGRFIMPRDSAAGWIDEALAKWYEARLTGLPEETLAPAWESAMGVTSPYQRGTHNDAWHCADTLIAYLHADLRRRGHPNGMLDFLSEWYASFASVPTLVGAEDLQAALERFAAVDLDDVFQTCVFGRPKRYKPI